MNKGFFLLWAVLLLLSCLFVSSKTKQCIRRKFDEDSTVCVCNATYCDAIGPVHLLAIGKYIAYTSSRDGLRFSKSQGNFTAQPLNNTDTLVNINARDTHQTIYGWGGAFTDAAGINIYSLNKKVRRQLLRAYFSSSGIEYSMCRVPIGSSDFSTRYYSYAEVDDDVNLTNFKLTVEDYKYKIPFIKQAMRMSNNSIKLFGSVWISPLWMKTNGKPAGYGFLKKQYYQTWADYHLKFLDAYDRHGIKFWGITTGNEPVDTLIPVLNISNVGWLPWEQGKWIAENLGPTIRNSKYNDTKIIAIDDQESLVLIWLLLETLFSAAEAYIDGIGIHWYFNKYFPSPLRLTHLVFPDKFILGTEACAGDIRYTKRVALGSWERGESYADDIIKDMNLWVSGWVEWNLALNTHGGPSYIENFVDATVIVNATAQEFYKQPTFYFIGHFSKFVPPASVRISTIINTKLVSVVAFLRPDNGIALVICNKQNHNVPITIYDPRRGYLSFDASSRSISTIVYL